MRADPNRVEGRIRRDLGGIDLTVDEKLSLGRQMAEAALGPDTRKKLQEKYNLQTRSLYRYQDAWLKNSVLFPNTGRPPNIDPEYMDVATAALQENDYQVRTANWKFELQEAAKKTAAKRGRDPGRVKPISRRTLARVEIREGIDTGNAEPTTTARATAISDVRNAVSFAAMNQHMVEECQTAPELILNMDATQFQVGYDTKGKIEIKYKTDDKKNMLKKGPLKVLPEKSDAGITAFFIKYYMLMSAAGYAANPVYVLADDSMDEDEIDVHEVKGLSVSPTLGGTGYLVFSKTRGCNLAFYKWYNEKFLIPFTEATRDHFDLPADETAWFQLDGEPIQIKIFEDADMLAQLDAAHIVVGKPPGSTTEITQPCDRGKVFKGPKTANRNISDKDVSGDKYLLGKISECLKEHVHRMKKKKRDKELARLGLAPTDAAAPVEEEEGGEEEPDDTWSADDIEKRDEALKILDVKTMKAAHIKMALYGLLRVNYALQLTMKCNMIKESFQLCGIYPYSTDQILASCKTAILLEESDHIKSVLPALSALIGEESELFDKDFEEFNIRNNKNSSKDSLTTCRRRSIFLNGGRHRGRQQIRKHDKEMGLEENSKRNKDVVKEWRLEWAEDAKDLAREAKAWDKEVAAFIKKRQVEADKQAKVAEKAAAKATLGPPAKKQKRK
jgi:hypothetical protein